MTPVKILTCKDLLDRDPRRHAAPTAGPYATIAADVRVLIDYRPALRERTGVGEFVHQLVSALATTSDTDDSEADPIEVTVFSSSWKDRLPDRAATGLPSHVSTIDRRIPVRLLNLAWHRAGWPPIESFAGHHFDVVHSPHPLLIPTRAAAQVVTIHDLDFLDHPERADAEVRRDYPALARRHAHRAAHIVVPSRYTAAQVERRLQIPPEAISLCWNGAPAWTPRAAAPSRGHLLFVGTLAPRKNVGVLLEAYALLAARHPEAPELVLAGSPGEQAAEWLAAIERPPLAGHVRCTGYLDTPALKEAYAGACALVLPSLDEGFGLPALEAMTVGVPVVAANRGALPEVVGDAGLLVDPTDPGALADAIERLVGDTELRSTCVERGFARAQAYSWQASARAVRGAYRKAVAARARATHAAEQTK